MVWIGRQRVQKVIHRSVANKRLERSDMISINSSDRHVWYHAKRDKLKDMRDRGLMRHFKELQGAISQLILDILMHDSQ